MSSRVSGGPGRVNGCLVTLRRLRRAVVIGAVAMFALTACAQEGASPIPLPGGAPRGDYYTVDVAFRDVLDLVPEASVKVNDVSVGSVERIWLEGWTARVRLRIENQVKLPDNSMAALRQTSLLGEKFVELVAPPRDEWSKDRLEDGDEIDLRHTSRSVEVEEVLAAMSLILNGGGLANLRTINKELGTALEGREKGIKNTLGELNTFIKGLDDQKEDIVRAIDALDRLSARLAKERGTVAKALDAMGPGLKVLSGQRKELVDMLKALKRLGKVGTRVIRASRDETLAVLRDLRPILTQLVKSGSAFPRSLDYLLTYPLPPNINNAIHDGFVNLHARLDLDAMEILKNLTSEPEPIDPQKGDDKEAGLPGLPGVPDSQRGGLTDLLTGGLTR